MTPTPSPAFLRGPVSTLQEMLRTISHVDRAIPFLRPTGIFDEDTLAAVMTFQIKTTSKLVVCSDPRGVSTC